MRKAIGILRICFVRSHVERCLGMPRVDANRWNPCIGQRMIKPYRKGTSLKDDPSGVGRMLMEQGYDAVRVGFAFTAPDPSATAPNGNGCLFQRHIKPDILFHGCSPMKEHKGNMPPFEGFSWGLVGL